MHFLDDFIPTVTPSLAKAVEAVNDNLEATRKLVETVSNLTALGVIALIVVLGILYVVFVARKRTTDNDTVRLQVEQTGRLIQQIEAERKERGELLTRLLDRDEKREDNVLEIVKQSRDGLTEVKAIVTAFNSRDIQNVGVVTNLEKAVSQMRDEGSEPVKVIRANTDSILKNSSQLLNAVDNLTANQVRSEDYSTSITELKLAISALQASVDQFIKRRTDTIPQITAVTPSVQL